VHAVVIREAGGPEVLTWTEVPDPAPPGPGEVLIQVVATAVNRADLLQRQGHYPPMPGTPPYPGLECSGLVAALGPDVERWQIGDEVVALLAGGGYAEMVVAPAGQVMPRPEGIDLVSAAALPEVVCTVWSNVFMLAGLRHDETLLVHGGASGIGTMAIQLARAGGSQVLVTAGSAAKLARCLELGAQAGINYREEDFVARCRDLTGGHGADVVLDNMGASYLGRNVEVLATNGRVVIVGLQGGTRAELDLGALMAKRAAVLSTSLRIRPHQEKAAICRSVVEHVWPLVAKGEVRPVVDRVLPLSEAAAAHRIVEASEHVGKVVLANGSAAFGPAAWAAGQPLP
jgi:putative PIG3 family NAD(P)H quinone oxidoreductase